MNWEKVVGTVAPTLAKALVGPLGGMGMNMLMETLGIDTKAPDAAKQLEKTMQTATPETLAKIKEVDVKFKAEMKRLDVDLEALHARDRASARRREQAVGGYSNPVLAFVIIGGFFATIGYVLVYGFNGMEASAVGTAGTLVGYVSAKAEQVVSYYFGSSQSSARKTELMKINS